MGGGRDSREKAIDPLEIDDDHDQQVLNFDRKPFPISDTVPIVRMAQLLQLPFRAHVCHPPNGDQWGSIGVGSEGLCGPVLGHFDFKDQREESV